MARTRQERERLKAWAMNWRPQPTHDRLNRYRKIKFGSWREYHKGRLVLRLTPGERRKAFSIYGYLLEKHRSRVVSGDARYRNMLWACAVSRCRKKAAHVYEHWGAINRLRYWQDRVFEEGSAILGIPAKREAASRSLRDLEEENLRANWRLRKLYDDSNS